MAKIVLASGSPRRQELLQRMGIADFDIRVPENVDESYPEGLTPTKIVEYISKKKAEAAAALCQPEEILVTADTMVFLEDKPLGKPKDAADALGILISLQGRSHIVRTGVTVRRGEMSATEVESTVVHFRPASPAELLSYVHTGEPMDKAGAYGVQGLGALLITGIEGDFYNVMGLPIMRLSQMLGRFGVKFFD